MSRSLPGLISLVLSTASASAFAGTPTFCFPNSTTTSANDVLYLTGSNPEDAGLSAGTGLCSGYYIADFRLSTSAEAVDIYGIGEAGGALIEGATDVVASDCEGLHVSVMFFSKASGTTKWSLGGSGTLDGVWVDGGTHGFSYCTLELATGIDSVSVKPPTSGTLTWRVAVQATVDGSAVIVGAEAAMPAVPPS